MGFGDVGMLGDPEVYDIDTRAWIRSSAGYRDAAQHVGLFAGVLAAEAQALVWPVPVDGEILT